MNDIPELLTGLALTPKLLAELVQGIPTVRLDLRRGENFWTIAEHVSRLAEVQPMLLGRLERLATTGTCTGSKNSGSPKTSIYRARLKEGLWCRDSPLHCGIDGHPISLIRVSP